LDPPRAGASAQAAQLAESAVPTLVAMSCNPGTLARDLRILVDGGYRITRVVPIDQFLFSPRIEVVAHLKR
jgi:23S rRNA (uracil1939-C5)-methyltransferase